MSIKKEIDLITKKLKKSKRPLIHLGHGVKLSKSQKIIKKFFNKFKIPFVLTWNADDIISSKHNMYFGKPGAFGERAILLFKIVISIYPLEQNFV